MEGRRARSRVPLFVLDRGVCDMLFSFSQHVVERVSCSRRPSRCGPEAVQRPCDRRSARERNLKVREASSSFIRVHPVPVQTMAYSLIRTCSTVTGLLDEVNTSLTHSSAASFVNSDKLTSFQTLRSHWVIQLDQFGCQIPFAEPTPKDFNSQVKNKISKAKYEATNASKPGSRVNSAVDGAVTVVSVLTGQYKVSCALITDQCMLAASFRSVNCLHTSRSAVPSTQTIRFL